MTLVEMMIVMILIAVVGSAVAFNMKGAVNRGKVFKTERTLERIDSILNLALLEGRSKEDVQKNWKEIVLNSPLIELKKDSEILDGWGKPISIQYHLDQNFFTAHSSLLPQDEEKLF